MPMNCRRPLDGCESSALIYLVAPLFVFFAFFVRIEIAIPACIFLASQLWAMIRQGAWAGFVRERKESLGFLAIATLWIWLSGGTGPVHQNGDWAKHYSVINFLVGHHWPATADIAGIGESVLRYSIGWYLIPALALKVVDVQVQTLALSVWSVLGIFLFFRLLPDITGRGRWAFAVPVFFVFFGGADAIGTLITRFQHGPVHHLEWWSSWIEFPSNTTSVFWVPQHAIPAWIGIALFMRAREKAELMGFLSVLGVAVFLWSPFSALGLVPFAGALVRRHGLRSVLLDWRQGLALLLLAIPLCLYMVASLDKVPSGPITSIPCLWEGAKCFTWPSYVLFLIVEVGFWIAILFVAGAKASGNRDFLLVAVLSLLLIPLYRLGINNDFGMRVPLPALAVLAILCGKVINTGTRRQAGAILLMLLLALPTTLGEMFRGFLPGGVMPEASFSDAWASKYLRQYFAPLPVWVIRK